MENEKKLKEIEKQKLGMCYENYKRKLFEINNDKLIHDFKQQLLKFTEIEIIIARLEKYDPKCKDLKNKYDIYIETGKKLIEENEDKFIDENLRTIKFLKFYIAFKLSFFCRKINMFEDEKYFNNITDSLSYEINKLISDIKNSKRHEFYKDEPLEGMFEDVKNINNRPWSNIFKWIGFSLLTITGLATIYFFRNRKSSLSCKR